jgi:hypothetical protein
MEDEEFTLVMEDLVDPEVSGVNSSLRMDTTYVKFEYVVQNNLFKLRYLYCYLFILLRLYRKSLPGFHLLGPCLRC